MNYGIFPERTIRLVLETKEKSTCVSQRLSTQLRNVFISNLTKAFEEVSSNRQDIKAVCGSLHVLETMKKVRKDYVPVYDHSSTYVNMIVSSYFRREREKVGEDDNKKMVET